MAPHGAEAREGHKELDGGRRSGTDRVGNIEKILQIRAVKVMDGLNRKQLDFELFSEFDQESVELLKDG